MSLNDDMRLDVLFRELNRVREKALKTDEWFFALLSVAIVPFLVLMGYCAVNPSYRILIASIPLISIVGILAVAILLNHYLYVGYYATYLEARVNDLLGKREIRDLQFAKVFYNSPSSIVTVSFATAFLSILLSNGLVVPLINHVRDGFLLAHPKLPGSYKWLLERYWPLVISSWCLVLISTALSFWFEVSLAKRLVLAVGRTDCAKTEGVPAA